MAKKYCFAMRIHGIVFKHKLPLIVMDLCLLHGNSCKKTDNDYHECPFRAIFSGYL